MKQILFTCLAIMLALSPSSFATNTLSDKTLSNRNTNSKSNNIQTIELPKLHFNPKDISAVISEETIEYHYGKHHQAYVANLNKLIKGTEYEGKDLEYIVCNSTGGIYNNAAQTWNHNFYFEQFGKFSEIKGTLADKIIKQWGSIEAFKKEFNTSAATLFGSGWVWLCVTNEGKLIITQEQNAGCPLTQNLKPLLTFDVWEHAYYIDYRNRRADYINALWEIINWEVIEQRYAKK